MVRGGTIITWTDFRNGLDYDIYAQRIDDQGSAVLATNGVPVSQAIHNQRNAVLASDNNGGAIIVWNDNRSLGKAPPGDDDIYAQKIDSSGAKQWDKDDVAISDFAGKQQLPQIVSDGGEGAIIAWWDYRGGLDNVDIYAQKVDKGGALQWQVNGVRITGAYDDQKNFKMIADNAGGAILSWEDYRVDPKGDIYAQRIDGDGKIKWSADGVVVAVANGYQSAPTLTSDGKEGAIITWYDDRFGSYDILAQAVDLDGSLRWGDQGVIISNAYDMQLVPEIVNDNDGGAIITWYDKRNGAANLDIYAQIVTSDGKLK